LIKRKPATDTAGDESRLDVRGRGKSG